MPERNPDLVVHPLTADRWSDLESLFGPKGACGGCWCMWFRLAQKQFVAGKGEGNRQAFKALVEAGRETGLLAYRAGEPVGWCAVAPRSEFTRLERSRTLAPVDDQPVWSVVCFFVKRGFRRSGVSQRLLEAAVEHVRARGGRLLEAYPLAPRKPSVPDVFAYHGVLPSFLAAGFEEVARRSPTRPIVRRGV